MNTSDASEVLNAFAGKKLVVIGDLVADEYVYGTTSRISREAPVLIVNEDKRELRLGGGANVVANIKAMGAEPIPVGLVGEDGTGKLLLQMLDDYGIDCSGVVVDQGRFTSTKTRVLAGGRNTVRQQMLRLDRLNIESVSEHSNKELQTSLFRALDDATAVVVSDYGEGVVGDRLVEIVCDLANQGISVFVDSRFKVGSFHGVGALVPNEPEMASAVGYELGSPGSVESAGRWLLEKTGSGVVLLKRGRNGMALFQPDTPTQYAQAYGSAEVADVTGAGDTVLAAWSLAKMAGASPVAAMRIANLAGGIKVRKAGTAVVKNTELIDAVQNTDF